MRKPVRIIKAEEIRKYYSMHKAIDAMARAFSSLSSGESYVPLRYVSKLPSGKMLMLFKPALTEKDDRLSVKFLTQRKNNPVKGVPTIQGIVILIDSGTGEILSVMDGEYLTALRTGAAGGLATRLLAREDSRTMALFGCGAQGRTQLEAVLCERDIKKVYVFDKYREAADLLIGEMEKKYQIEMVYSCDTSILNEVDIIATATNSTEPLFKRDELNSGVHINAIGSFQPQMQELDPILIRDAKVYVDQLESCLKESGDLIKPISDGIIDSTHIMGEIGDICLDKIAARDNGEEITIFKSVGVAIQDLAVAADIYDLALKESYGQDIDLFG